MLPDHFEFPVTTERSVESSFSSLERPQAPRFREQQLPGDSPEEREGGVRPTMRGHHSLIGEHGGDNDVLPLEDVG